jgi:RHS repeat-associated protein
MSNPALAPNFRSLPVPLKITTWVLIFVQLFTSPAVLLAANGARSDTTHPKPVYTPKHVKVNKTKPKVTRPSPIPTFSNPATDQEIFASHAFLEPLVPAGAKSTPAENKQMAQAILAYIKGKDRDDVSAFNQFLQANPKSVWRGALLTNLGIIYRRSGYYSRAVGTWEEAWKLLKNEVDGKPRGMADRAVAELLSINSSLGRMEKLKPLLEEIKSRNLAGSANARMILAKGTLWQMQHHPETSFKCGPYALGSILSDGKKTPQIYSLIDSANSVPQGFSLPQVYDISQKLKMNYQMAVRKPGSTIITPSMVHWKSGHYAAIIRKQGDTYLVKDPTFGADVQVKAEAIDDEASGFFLVPAGSLPTGWRVANNDETKNIWGRGLPINRDPHAPPPHYCTCSFCKFGMAAYGPSMMMGALLISDTPITYSPPVGPGLDFSIHYNQMDVDQPSSFTFSNFGTLWTHNLLSYVNTPGSVGGTTTVYVRGGSLETYNSSTFTSTGTNQGYFAPDVFTQAQLYVLSATDYERRMPDGSKEVYNMAADGSGRIFLTSVVDPQGNALTFSYDGYYRLSSVTDALSQVTTFGYSLSGDMYKITSITDPFSRTATFTYNSASPAQLASITDVVGLTSQFTYGSGSFITALTTPYGTTTFLFGTDGNTNSLLVTDPLGGQERIDSVLDATGITPSSVSSGLVPTGLTTTNNYMQYRNTYYWDKKAMMSAPGNHSQAHLYHWLHTTTPEIMEPILESEQAPLENRVWYNYPGQPASIDIGTSNQPTAKARVLDDSSTQLYQTAYNTQGLVTQTIDPSGRSVNYDYDTNGFDLLMIRQTTGSSNEVIEARTYDVTYPPHCPKTLVDASGQTTTYTYNSAGQVLTVTNPLSQVTTSSYTSGYLMTVTGPVSGSTTTYTYDGFGRVRTVTDSDSYTLTYDYDALNRQTVVTYPDTTFTQYYYNRLDVEWTKDRIDRWTHDLFDANQHRISSQDPAGNTTIYGWCVCGSLDSITDPNGNTTSWTRDIQSRVTAKTYPDSTSTSYAYESTTSRLHTETDALSQVKTYAYAVDNDLTGITYSSAIHTTPNVTFTYDTNYNRLLTMADGTGTTTYAYNPYTAYSSWPLGTPTTGAGRLASITGPLSSSAITSTYDELGRELSRSINGSANPSSVTYDSLSRISTVVNPLGTFTPTYVSSVSLRLASIAYPNGQSANFTYLSTSGDLRISEIKNLNSSSAVISKFNYTYDAEGETTTWKRQADSGDPSQYALAYDGTGQLTAANDVDTTTSSIINDYFYGYDATGNRTSEQVNAASTGATFNNLNQLTAKSSGGPVRFTGTTSQPTTVNVGGITAAMLNSTNFVANVPLSVGTNLVSVVAKNYTNLYTTNNYQVVTTAGTSQSLTYDSAGNLTGDGNNTYEWDAENRLSAINYISTSYRTEMSYDGLNRRTKIVEKNGGGTVTSTKQFVWIGDNLAEERDASNSVTKRFYGLGQQISGTSYYYAQDHLGSIREMTDGSGTIQARYDYDPYGRTTKVSGSLESDFEFAGYYRHLPSRLDLTLRRGYSDDLGRWLSRDPIGENGGINVYGYVQNNPISFSDPLGLLNVPRLPNVVPKVPPRVPPRLVPIALCVAIIGGLVIYYYCHTPQQPPPQSPAPSPPQAPQNGPPDYRPVPPDRMPKPKLPDMVCEYVCDDGSVHIQVNSSGLCDPTIPNPNDCGKTECHLVEHYIAPYEQ